jgi:hypothetical protein
VSVSHPNLPNGQIPRPATFFTELNGHWREIWISRFFPKNGEKFFDPTQISLQIFIFMSP